MAGKTQPQMPAATIDMLARSVFEQARGYGFNRLDQVRLASALLSLCNAAEPETSRAPEPPDTSPGYGLRPAAPPACGGLLARSSRLDIHTLGVADARCAVVAAWLQEMFAAHFLVSAATAQPRDLPSLLSCPRNLFGLFCLHDGRPVGVVAYLDRDDLHRRAEVRVLIGAPGMRRLGYAAEALRTWLDYGFAALGLEKVVAQVPVGDVRSLRAFEQLGFSIEAVLPGELRIAGERQDAVRCGLLRPVATTAGGA